MNFTSLNTSAKLIDQLEKYIEECSTNSDSAGLEAQEPSDLVDSPLKALMAMNEKEVEVTKMDPEYDFDALQNVYLTTKVKHHSTMISKTPQRKAVSLGKFNTCYFELVFDITFG